MSELGGAESRRQGGAEQGEGDAPRRWFLVAHCREREAIRWFVLDQIVTAHLTAEAATDIPVAAVGAPPPTARAVAGES
ncbi:MULTISPECIES: WYL domain-containing protein [Brevibacterium]|uniref:WYL domain-containing protein n=1 Tax=Brevibacterium TaxID=1696 RepID=UPI001BA9F3ED|nr:WYL domain-containing protein [Brevibacterium sp. W7.2]